MNSLTCIRFYFVLESKEWIQKDCKFCNITLVLKIFRELLIITRSIKRNRSVFWTLSKIYDEVFCENI